MGHKVGNYRAIRNSLTFNSHAVSPDRSPNTQQLETLAAVLRIFTRSISLEIFRTYLYRIASDVLFGLPCYTCFYQLCLFSIPLLNDMAQSISSFLPLNPFFHSLLSECSLTYLTILN